MSKEIVKVGVEWGSRRDVEVGDDGFFKEDIRARRGAQVSYGAECVGVTGKCHKMRAGDSGGEWVESLNDGGV